jgi:hypothetical protein
MLLREGSGPSYCGYVGRCQRWLACLTWEADGQAGVFSKCHIQSYELVVSAFHQQVLSKEAILVIATKLGCLHEAAEAVAVRGGVSRCSLQGVSCYALYAVRTG